MNNDLEVAHPQSGSSSTWFLVELEFVNIGFWGEGKTGVPGEKPLGASEWTNNKLHKYNWRQLYRHRKKKGQPPFSMICTRIEHRNDVIKCSKLKWNHHPQAWLYCKAFFTITFIFFTKNKNKNNRHCVTGYVISMIYTLIDYSSRPISPRVFAQLL